LNNFTVIFLLINVVVLLILPRRFAPVPLLIAVCYMTYGQGFSVGSFSFTVIRVLIVTGIIRVLLRGERIKGGLNKLDWLMLFWASWALTSSLFRPDVTAALIFRLGLVYNTCGIYFLFRIFIQSVEDVWRMIYLLIFILLPISFEMINEHLLNHNFFSIFGGVPSIPFVREGSIRAQGPFRHPILAGTVGAVCMPLAIALWSKHRKAAVIGMFSCVTIVICSKSSGPLVSLLTGVGAMTMWRYRYNMKALRWLFVGGYIVLDIVMKADPYYLMGRIPLVKGSTGWHRAELINTAIRHFNEWWLWGTDYTRHWMPTGVSWSPDHTDITNHYIKMGVLGGLPLMILFVLILAKGFSYVGQVIAQPEDAMSHVVLFMIWALGASLFANAATMISVSYFDQSFVFLYLVLAMTGSIWSDWKIKKSGNPVP